MEYDEFTYLVFGHLQLELLCSWNWKGIWGHCFDFAALFISFWTVF
jgi:hypothetical protein